MGQAVGATVQLAVTQRLAVAHQGNGVGARLRLGLQQPMHALVLRKRHGRVVPAVHLLLPLGIIQQGQFTDTATAILGHPVQQAMPMGKEALQARGVEQVSGIGQRRLDTVSRLLSVEAEVELRRLAVPLQPLHLQPRYAAATALSVGLVVEHHLEQRVVAQAALGLQRFHQLFERQVLMGLGLDRALAGLLQQFTEGHLAVDIGLEDLRVDEKADQALGLHPITVGHRHADADVTLAAVAVQHSLERRQQQHEDRHTFTLRQGLEACHQRGFQGQVQPGPAVAL
ncbi:hypothetical protein FX984_06376 [Pseudomonas marginalis]|nr:hypothetical protein FX984_06376 [Pseudomonas marginalis]